MDSCQQKSEFNNIIYDAIGDKRSMIHRTQKQNCSYKDADSIVKLSNKGIVSSVTNQQNGDLISEIDARLELAERQLDEVKALIVKDVRDLGKEYTDKGVDWHYRDELEDLCSQSQLYQYLEDKSYTTRNLTAEVYEYLMSYYLNCFRRYELGAL